MFPLPSPSSFLKGGGGSTVRCLPVSMPPYFGTGSGPVDKDSSESLHCSSNSSTTQCSWSSPGQVWRTSTWRSSSCVSLALIWLIMSRLTNPLQLVESATADGTNDAFNFLSRGAGKIVFEVFLKLYIGVIFVVLVCSLGNRPQGSKWTYSISMILFGLCNIITLWCAGYTVYLAVPHTLDGWKQFPEYVLFQATKWRDRPIDTFPV